MYLICCLQGLQIRKHLSYLKSSHITKSSDVIQRTGANKRNDILQASVLNTWWFFGLIIILSLVQTPLKLWLGVEQWKTNFFLENWSRLFLYKEALGYLRLPSCIGDCIDLKDQCFIRFMIRQVRALQNIFIHNREVDRADR